MAQVSTGPLSVPAAISGITSAGSVATDLAETRDGTTQSALVLSTRALRPLFVPVLGSLVNFAATLGSDIQEVLMIGLCLFSIGEWACSPPPTDFSRMLAISSETYPLCFLEAIFVVYITAPKDKHSVNRICDISDEEVCPQGHCY